MNELRFHTTFIVSGVPLATTREKDFEAESAKQAAHLALEYWPGHLSGEIKTEVCVHVRGYDAESGELNKQALYGITRGPGSTIGEAETGKGE